MLFGSDGVLMVDTEDLQLAAKTLDVIRTFTSAPIKIVVNSHIHSDHTGGNAFFAKQGAVIFSQENLRDEMQSPPGQGNGARAPDPASVPTAVYRYGSPGTPAVTIHMNGETVDFIPMMPSHTAGDTIVRFNKANVIYIEDFYRNFGYPFADQANGGSIKGMQAPIPRSSLATERWSGRRICWDTVPCSSTSSQRSRSSAIKAGRWTKFWPRT